VRDRRHRRFAAHRPFEVFQFRWHFDLSPRAIVCRYGCSLMMPDATISHRPPEIAAVGAHDQCSARAYPEMRRSTPGKKT
jgi:hypothetical protein